MPSALRDPRVQVLLLLTLVLELLVWSRLEGYTLADSIEYLTLAQTWYQGHSLGTDVRSFLFPLLLTPLFAVADLLGVEDQRVIVPVARLLQALLGVAFVAASVRLGRVLGGRGCGVAAGFVALFNPIFLRHCVDPMTGVLAGTLLALGFERFLQRHDFRRSLIGGVLLGVGFLVSYKVLVVVLGLGLLLLVRDRWRHRVTWLGLAAGVAMATVLQLGIDKLVYGQWGISLANYLSENVGGILVHFLLTVNLRDAAHWVYSLNMELRGYESGVLYDVIASHRRRPTWYVENSFEFLVPPAMVLAGFAFWRTVRHPRWASSIVLCILALYLVILSSKGSKSFRLWIPMIPLVSAYCALGWVAIVGAPGEQVALWRRRVGVALVVLVVLAGAIGFQRENPRRFSDYWQAMAYINGTAEPERSEPYRFTAVHEFAVHFRYPPHLRLVRPSRPIWSWIEPGEEPNEDRAVERAAAGREALRLELQDLDYLIAPHDMLSPKPSLLGFVRDRFEVETVFDGRGRTDRGPLYVLAKPDGERTRPFFDLVPRGGGGEPAVTFERQLDDGTTDRVHLLGWDWEELPGSGLGWLTCRWTADAPTSREYRIRTQLTTADGRRLFSSDVLPGYGTVPTSEWKPEWVLEEGRVVELDASRLPQDTRLWVSLVEVDGEGRVIGSMTGVHTEAGEVGSLTTAAAPADVDAVATPTSPR